MGEPSLGVSADRKRASEIMRAVSQRRCQFIRWPRLVGQPPGPTPGFGTGPPGGRFLGLGATSAPRLRRPAAALLKDHHAQGDSCCVVRPGGPGPPTRTPPPGRLHRRGPVRTGQPRTMEQSPQRPHGLRSTDVLIRCSRSRAGLFAGLPGDGAAGYIEDHGSMVMKNPRFGGRATSTGFSWPFNFTAAQA